VTATSPEEACETVIYSAGGFSNVLPLPSYQASAVAYIIRLISPLTRPRRKIHSQAVRGYPDVAANSANYVVGLDGQLQLLYGTSCSSPTFGALNTLINEQRIKAGKSVVGFIKPVIYAHPSAFNDITSGGNRGCGTPGILLLDWGRPIM
jgi:tripeptidyl-peptidase I